MSSPLCTSPRCWRDPDTGELEPRPAAAGLRLCWQCRDQLARDIDRLPHICRDLLAALASTGGNGPAVSGTPEPGLPLNVRAAAARAEILPVLAAWAGLIAEQRGFTPPPRDPEALAWFLGQRRNVDWLAAYPAAGDAVDEIAEARRIAARAAYTQPARRVEVGNCPENDCPGVVFAIVRDPAAVLPSAAECDHDPDHAWPIHEWPRLRRRMRATT